MSAVVSPAALETFVRDLLAAYGVDSDQCGAVACILVWSELVGRPNFGVQRLPVLIKRIEAGVIAKRCDVKVTRSSPGLALVDGGGGFGHFVGERAMAEAIELARATGLGAAGVRNSNFYGAGAYFVDQAAKAGMIGLALSNSFPKVAAHGGFLPVLGTNPFAFGAPRRDGRSFMLDMATSGLAGSTVREHIEKRKPLPEGLAVDGEGRPITDPARIDDGALLPFGGAKGFGLALMVEILSAVVTGAGMGQGVGSMYKDFSRFADNGHFMLALNIAKWMPIEEYYNRFEALVAMVKASDPNGGVLLPGEIRWQEYERNKARGIEVPQAQRDALRKLAEARGVKMPWK